MRWIAAALLIPYVARAHDGHVGADAHLHVWDMLGLLALLLVVMVIVRLRR